MEILADAGTVLGACREENIDYLKNFIKQSRGQVDQIKDKNEKCMLHYCMENKNTECAEFVLKHYPESIDFQDITGVTPLHLATVVGNTKMMTLLINYGANVNMADKDRHTAVHWAVVYSQLEGLRILLNKEAIIDDSDIHGAFPIHYAAQACENANNEEIELKIIQFLIENGGDVNCRDSFDRCPLHWTTTINSQKCTELLLSLGADMDVVDSTGLAPIHCAASKGCTDIITDMLKNGASVETKDKNGCSPLFYATSNGHLKSAKVLIDAGADVNHKDIKGRTSMHCAAAKNQPKLFDILKENDADPWIPNEEGDAPLHEACFIGNNQLVKALLNIPGAEKHVDVTNNSGQTPLHLSVARNNIDNVTTLIEYGADLNKTIVLKDGNEVTALDITTDAVCEELLQKSGAKSAKNKDTEELEHSDKQSTIIEESEKSETFLSEEEKTDEPVKQSEPETDIVENENSILPTDNSELDNKEIMSSSQLTNPSENEAIANKTPEPSSGTPINNNGSVGETINNNDSIGETINNNDSIGETINNNDSIGETINNNDSIGETINNHGQNSVGVVVLPMHEESKSEEEQLSNEYNSEEKENKNTEAMKSSSESDESSISSSKYSGKKQPSCPNLTKTGPTEIKYKEKETSKNHEPSHTRTIEYKEKERPRTTKYKEKPYFVPLTTSRRPKTSKKEPEQALLITDLNRRSANISREIYRQIHQSVANYEFVRFTARAIEEYGRHMIRNNAVTSKKGFAVFEKSRSLSPRKRNPNSYPSPRKKMDSNDNKLKLSRSISVSSNSLTNKSRSSSASPGYKSGRSSSSESSRTSVTIDDKNYKNTSDLRKPAVEKDNRPVTRASNLRPRTGKQTPSRLQQRTAMSKNKDRAIRNAYAPFLPK